ncbi:MAG: hypothetical protein HY329_18700, partial [Chloroflexi bacterium]|nr:hypothetical protein [Chloroflexota bacterium]
MAESWYAEGRYVVSPHNYAPEVRQGLDLPPDGRVTIFDGTIRKVLMMPGARARVADTVRLGEMLAELGITESLLIVQWRGDTQPVELELEAARALLARNLPINFTVATDVAMTDQWKLAVDCPRDVGARMIDIMLPATDGMIRQAGTTREGVLERMDEVFAYAHEQKLTPAFTLADAARCDLEFLVQLCNHALALGAVRFDLSDSAGTMSPDAMRYFIRTLRGRLTRAVPITVHVHDDFGLATASAVAATTAGALPEASVTGASYRSGFAALEEVALALEALY